MKSWRDKAIALLFFALVAWTVWLFVEWYAARNSTEPSPRFPPAATP